MRAIQSFREMFEVIKKSPWPLQLLFYLALSHYFFLGFLPSLFTNGFDFTPVYNASRLLWEGKAHLIYENFFTLQAGTNSIQYYMYPPPVALFYMPLSFFSLQKAFLLYQLINHGMLWLTLFLLIRFRPFKDNPESSLIIFVLLFLYFPIYYTLQLGQSEILLLACLLVSNFLFIKKRFVPSSLLLVIAIYLKIFLAFILFFYILKRRYRYLLYCIFWLALLSFASLHYIPLEIQVRYWTHLFSPIGIEALPDNHALSGPIFRMLTHTLHAEGAVDAPVFARMLLLILSTIILTLYAKTIVKLKEDYFEIGYSFTIITLLLIAPYVDSHHHVLLLFPLLTILAHRTLAMSGVFFYAFFASIFPIVAFKFFSLERYLFLSSGPVNIIFSLQFFALLIFWIYFRRFADRTNGVS